MTPAWRPVAGLALTLAAALAVAQTGGSGNTAGARQSKESRAGSTPAADASSKQAWERTHRASRIIGMDVVNRQGQKIGDIEDIVLDRNGNVAYAVVSTGGFLGVGDKLHAVPWRSLAADAGGSQFVLDVDKETLGKAPGFDNSTFPDLNDPKWIAENRKHFPATSAAARSTTIGAEASAPGKKERDDARSSSGRSATGNDVGPTTSTSRRSGPAAGSGASTATDAGSTSGTAAGSTATSDSRPKPPRTTGNTGGSATTNPAGGPGGIGDAAAPGTPGSGNGPITGTTK